MTRIVNRHLDKFDRYIGRGTPLGNKFIIGKDGSRLQCISKYKVDFYRRLKEEVGFKDYVESCRGLILGCSCKPLPCHGDVVVEYLEGGVNIIR